MVHLFTSPRGSARRPCVALLGSSSLLGRTSLNCLSNSFNVVHVDVEDFLIETKPPSQMLSGIDIVVNLVDYQDLRLFPNKNNLNKYNVDLVHMIVSNSCVPLVHASSCFVQCSTTWPNVYEQEADPAKYKKQWPFPDYCESKYKAEELIRQSGREYCILRLCPVFGPGDTSSPLTDLIRLSSSFGDYIPRIGDGEGFVQMAFVENVASVVCKAVDKLLVGRIALPNASYSLPSTPFRKVPVLHRRSFIVARNRKGMRMLETLSMLGQETEAIEKKEIMDSNEERKCDDQPVEVARCCAREEEALRYADWGLLEGYDERDLVDLRIDALRNALPVAFFWDSDMDDDDSDILEDTLSTWVSDDFRLEEMNFTRDYSREMMSSSSEDDSEQSDMNRTLDTLNCSIDNCFMQKIEEENDEKSASIRREIVLVADDTPKGNVYEVFDPLFKSTTSYWMPLLPLYLLYLMISTLLLLFNSVYPLSALHHIFDTLPHPNFFYLHFRHWTFFNTAKCNLLFGYKYEKEFKDAIEASKAYYSELRPNEVKQFSWMPFEFGYH